MYTAPKRRAGVGASFRVHKLCPRSRTSPGPQIRDARSLQPMSTAKHTLRPPRALSLDSMAQAMTATLHVS